MRYRCMTVANSKKAARPKAGGFWQMPQAAHQRKN
jgi:hypothetical protein